MISMSLSRRSLVRTLAVTAGIAGLLSAQEQAGSIIGSVTDPNDEPIAGATVTVTDPKSKQTWEAQVKKFGNYSIKDVPPGSYLVQAKAPGYRPFSLKDVPVEKGEATYVDIVMKKQ